LVGILADGTARPMTGIIAVSTLLALATNRFIAPRESQKGESQKH
jgi:hypothetical protein